jgi:hypothetical protein
MHSDSIVFGCDFSAITDSIYDQSIKDTDYLAKNHPYL